MAKRSFISHVAQPRRPASAALVAFSLLGAVGCSHLGPSTIPRDRLDYTTSMTESWKRQILLNIVRLRYLEPPSFVDVAQIVSGYTLETGVNASGQFGGRGLLGGGSFGILGGHATFTDRPTVTYAPLNGRSFQRSLMTPIPPESLFYTIESGWPADTILKTGVSRVNGLKNESVTIDGYQPPDAKFVRVIALLREIQKSGAVGMKIVQDKEHHATDIITLRSGHADDVTDRNVAECRELLGLNKDASEFQLVFGANASNDHELAVQTRSLLHIMTALAARAEVPEAEVRDHRVIPGMEPTGDRRPPIRCTQEKPEEAFVDVKYRGHWFWVDDGDLVAKRDIAFMMLLFTLADTGEKQALPMVTIQAQ